MLALPIDEASAKIRRGPPSDDEDDYAGDTWAGVIPLRMAAGEAVAIRACATASTRPP